jgi:hypothetical protein
MEGLEKKNGIQKPQYFSATKYLLDIKIILRFRLYFRYTVLELFHFSVNFTKNHVISRNIT